MILPVTTDICREMCGDAVADKLKVIPVPNVNALQNNKCIEGCKGTVGEPKFTIQNICYSVG